MADDITYLYGTIAKRDDEQRTVEGFISSPDLDLDQQIVDQEWLKKELPPWMLRYGNIREQHDPRRAVGKAKSVDLETRPGPYLAAKIVDEDAWKKVKEGVYNGFSVGIKAPKIVSDPQARNGRIVGGKLIEISIVDRPANDAAKFVVLKAAGPGEWRDVQSGAVLAETRKCSCGCSCAPGQPASDCDCSCEQCKAARASVQKRDFSRDERDRPGDSGAALPDGSFPVANEQDLRDAIRAIGRAKDPARAKAHIKRRARALGKTDLLPDEWRNGMDEEKTAQPVGAEAAGAEKAAGDVQATNAGAAEGVSRPARIGGDVAAILRDALQRVEALAGETDRDRDGDVEYGRGMPRPYPNRAQGAAPAQDFQAQRPRPGTEPNSALDREQLVLGFSTRADLEKFIGEQVDARVRARLSEQEFVTKAAAGERLDSIPEIAKLAGGIAKGLEALADRTRATAEELVATKAALAETRADLARVKELAQPVKGAVFAIEKGIGLEPDRVVSSGRGTGGVEELAAKAAALGEPERQELFRAIYRATIQSR